MSISPIPNALFAGKRFLHLEAVDSTNTFCLENQEFLETPGLVVYADRQLAGRGRMGRAWEQGKGPHLFSSFVIHPNLQPELVPSLAICAGLAVHQVVRYSLGLEECSLKWPNDVLVAGRKVCGVLCESRSIQGAFRVVVGIGINITGRAEQFAAHLSARVATLEMFGVRVERDDLLAMVAESFDGILHEMHRGNHVHIFRRWTASSTSVGRLVRFRHEGEMLHGKVSGLDDLGRLVVETDANTRFTVLSGEVDFV